LGDQQRLPAAPGGGRADRGGNVARRPAGRGNGAAGSPVVRRGAVPPGVQVPADPTAPAVRRGCRRGAGGTAGGRSAAAAAAGDRGGPDDGKRLANRTRLIARSGEIVIAFSKLAGC